MLDLLKSYSVSDILIFLVVLCIALKGVFDFFEWGKNKLMQYFKKEKKSESHEEKIDKLEHNMNDLQNSFIETNKKIDLLISSDRDDIKAFITQQYHYFCEEQKWIDDYSLDCLERRFGHYKEEHGNSFIEELMVELRALPKHPPN